MRHASLFCGAKRERLCDMVPSKATAISNSAPLPKADASAAFQPEAWAFLNHLRFVAMACRAKPKADLFEACALLKAEGSASRDAHTDALMRCLAEALGKPARLFAPGTAEQTFDEQWLMRLGVACSQGDQDSLSFLLGSRVAFENRRLVRYLMGCIATRFFPD